MKSEVKKYVWAIVFLWLCIAIPVGIAPWNDNIFSKVGIIVGLIETFFPTVVITLVVCGPKCIKSIRKYYNPLILWIIVDFVAWALFFGELYVGYSLDARLNEAVLLLILQSDSGETAEFLQFALSQPVTWKVFFISLIPGVIAFAVWLMRNKIEKFLVRTWRWMKYCLIGATAVSGATFVWSCLPVINNNYWTLDRTFLITPCQALMSMKPLKLNETYIEHIADANDKIRVSRDSIKSVPEIVLVIGESDNKRHSSIYGYRLPTATALSDSLPTSGELLTYTDVVTGDCTTNFVMMRLLSTNLTSHNWEDRPLLMAALKAGGYDVGYYDNQSTPSTCQVVDYGSVFFLNSPQTAEQSYHHRNDRRFDYDSDFVAYYLPQALASEKKPSVVIFHLMGQHILAKERYRAENAKFDIKDYAELTDFSTGERTDIMHYDNATASVYSDLANIIKAYSSRDAIVIYLSDHSEEIYDYRHHYGRTQEQMTPERARTLFEVPMHIFLTEKFMENRPAVAETLRSNVNTPIFTYHLADLVLDLAGISGEMTSETRSIASPKYIPPRARLIHHATVDYDSIMKN